MLFVEEQKFRCPCGAPMQITPVTCDGGIAQLGERLHGMQEVSGSIPLTSTKNLRVSVALFKKMKD